MEKTVGKSGTSQWLKKHGLNTVLVAPLMIFVFSFTIVPIFQTILLSFKDQITSEWTLRNYAYVFGRSFFSEAVINTLFVSAIGLLIQMVIGYLLASMLRKNFVGKGLARTLVMLPMGIPTMVSGVAMLYLFGMSGYLNEILYRLNVTPIPIDWTANRLRSLFVVAVADSWKVMPMVVMLFLSGLESPGAVRGGGCGRRGKIRLLPLHHHSPAQGHGDHDRADQAGGPAANLRAA